jgi:sigma-B regulation protein RsbU (phosphoserine phosphatase)
VSLRVLQSVAVVCSAATLAFVLLQLAPGDRLFLYSDGVPEAMDKDRNPYGDDAMAACIAASRSAPIDAGVKALLEAVETWCQPNGPLDDVSILGVEWRP